ncbi:MAG: excinuclease ABC subunit UvrA, partial [Oscillospiraceae bacterium]|nr:excinuclease ABC subunit UvrA [Oscillospiraceae bacterium]
MPEKIVVKGARVHNLKNVTVEIPRNKLVIFTGVSGSGKSSLAFDVIYAESHRRYVESLSPYARQFLGQMDKPDVDSIEGLSPAISIDQKTTSKNPRSTVGTITEIYDYLRLLYARVGVPHCPKCNIEIIPQETDQITKRIIDFGQEISLQIFSPIISRKKGQHISEFDEARQNGFSKARIDGQICNLDEKIELDKEKKHNIEILIDQIIIRNDDKTRSRIAQAVELSSKISNGLIIAKTKDKEILFSKNYICPEHNISLGKLEPRLFSFNNPLGACKKCAGLGFLMKIDPDLLITNKNLSISEGAIKCAKWA